MLVEVEERATVANLLDQDTYTNKPEIIKSILKTHQTQKTHQIPSSALTSFEETDANTERIPIQNLNRTIFKVTAAVPSRDLKMERPKSAKHNIERFKKSFYTNYKRNLNMNRNLANSMNTNYSNNENTFQNDNSHEDNDDQEIMNNEMKNRKEQRILASKSAFAGTTKMRPQSARHNLEKYRQDIMHEKKREDEENLQHKKHRKNEENDDEIMHNEEITKNLEQKLKNIENLDNIESDGMNQNIDNLDGLLIREEEDNDSSSDEIDSQCSMNELLPHPSSHPSSNNNLKLQKSRSMNQQKLTNQKKQKLLDRRGAIGESTNNNNDESTHKQNASIHNNTNNKQEHNYTTFRPTAITHSGNQDPSNSILIAQQLKQKQNETSPISLHSTVQMAHGREDFDDEDSNVKNIGVNENVPCTNSSSSSSTSSQQLSSTLIGPKEDSIHLNNTEEILILDNRSKPPINNLTDLVTQKLLNEWHRNDEEVELTIEKLNNFDTNNSNNYNDYRNQKASAYNNSNHQQSRNSNQSLKQQIILLNTAGRTSRFSDYSSSTSNNIKNSVNMNANNSMANPHHNSHALNSVNLNNHNQQNFLNREKSSNSMDPWTRRNPTLVAQNVLIKHRTELEQLHNNRMHNNTSRQSNNTSNILTSTNKYLLPDNKYFKKNNNF